MTITHAKNDPEKDLILTREVKEQLTAYRMPLKRLAGRALTSGLSPELVHEVSEIRMHLQQLLKIVGGDTVPNGAAVSHPKTTPAQAKDTTPNGNAKPDKPPTRPRNKGFDLLLLAAPYARDRFGYPISHHVLFELAKHYDPSVGRATMVSKVNRYRNDKGWLTWQDSEDISITEKGKTAYSTLRQLAARDGDLPRVKDTFREVWKIDLPFD